MLYQAIPYRAYGRLCYGINALLEEEKMASLHVTVEYRDGSKAAGVAVSLRGSNTVYTDRHGTAVVELPNACETILYVKGDSYSRVNVPGKISVVLR